MPTNITAKLSVPNQGCHKGNAMPRIFSNALIKWTSKTVSFFARQGKSPLLKGGPGPCSFVMLPFKKSGQLGSNGINRRFFSFLLVFCFCCAAAGQTLAAENVKKVPTTINSRRMDYDANANTVLFTGDVHVKRPDFELWADKMTVYLEKSGNGAVSEDMATGMQGGEIDHIVAENNVRLKSQGREGSCSKATYYAKDDRFVMQGSPKLWDNKQSTITGGTIIHHLGSNKSEVLSNAGVTFYAPDKTDSPAPPTIAPVPQRGR